MSEQNYRGQTLVRGVAVKGDLVAYEDQANPRREGVVLHADERVSGGPLGFRDSATEYTVEFEDGTKTTSDLRQYGWTFVLSPEDRESDYRAALDRAETDRAYTSREEWLNVRAANRPF